jgi:putative Mg2+ transporter-C (MgtC) family protein
LLECDSFDSQIQERSKALNIIVFVIRLAVALFLGALIGLERQYRHRMAGTRTNALVASGAAAFVMAGSMILGDPSSQGRVAAYVISGIGFLGAGVIFKEGATVQGLNTAATIWRDWAIRSIRLRPPLLCFSSISLCGR